MKPAAQTISSYSESRACAHHWIIEAANGPTSQGRCKRCGTERIFMNNPEDARLQPDDQRMPVAHA